MKTKKLIISFAIGLISCIASAQVSLTVNVTTAGGLRQAITASGTNKTTVTNLTVTGNIDARDVKFMRDSMPVLSVIDLDAVQIKAYTGTGGTDLLNNSNNYSANQMPLYGFSVSNGTGNLTLKSIKLPVSITSIGNYSFDNCRGITGSLIIPNSVTSIGNNAFAFCTGFTGSLLIPNSVTSIGEGAFQGCSGITGLMLSNSITSIGIMAFDGCSGLTGSIIIPSTLTIINSNVFKVYSGVTSFYIPNSITSILSDAFGPCQGMQRIIVNKVVPIPITSTEFSSTNKTTCELIVPKGSKSAYAAANVWKDFTHITEAIFVLLNTQGGRLVAHITTTQENSTISEPNNPVRDGYSFAGWYKEAACTNVWSFATDVVMVNTTLYAKWTANPANSFTVNFNVNGGSPVADMSATNNTSIIAPTAPTKTGYTFAGWYKEATCTNAWNFTTDLVTAPVTLYAKWSLGATIKTIANKINLKIYPQPASDYIIVEGANFNQVSVIDLLGNKIPADYQINENKVRVDISTLKSGAYIVQAKLGNGKVQSIKLIKR